MECKKLTRVLEEQTVLITSLQARLEALEQSQSSPNEKRKKPNPPPATSIIPNSADPPKESDSSAPTPIHDMLSQLASQLSGITQELQLIRLENQSLQQELQNIRADHISLRNEIGIQNPSASSTDHTYDVCTPRPERPSKNVTRAHGRALPYARNSDADLSSRLADARDTASS